METVDIIEEVVQSINLTTTINSVVDNGDGIFTIEVCKSLWFQVGYPITIAGVNYDVVSFTGNSIVISGATLPQEGVNVEIGAVHYFHGTVIKAKEDMLSVKDSHNVFNRTPFIYLKETIREQNYTTRSNSPYSHKPQLRIFFLGMSNFEKWNTDDHYENSIKPMRKLVNSFIEACEKSNYIGYFDEFETINHANFGVYVDAKGHTKQIFVDNLSGVELNITLPFFKQQKENCANCA